MDPSDFLPSLNKAAERFRKKVQDLVAYCPTCQPYDGGAYVWVLGKRTTLENIFDDVNCPERYRDDIAEHIGCPNCGASNFGRDDTIGTEDRFNLAIDAHIATASRKHGKQLKELNEHLALYPSLALDTALGRKLHKEILSHALPETKASGIWCRARVVSGSQVYQANDMGAAPPGRAHSGRYHHAGQSVLYIADDETTAIREVLDNADKTPALIWIQKYEAELDDLLDLRRDWERMHPGISTVLVAALASSLFNQPVEDRSSTWKPQYFVTQFIADCARQAGYKGIVYSSTRGYGDNIAVFDPSDAQIKAHERPRVYIHEPLPQQEISGPEDLF